MGFRGPFHPGLNMYDVVVIGAGPGGGSAALHAARAGLSTLLIGSRPRDRNTGPLRRMSVRTGRSSLDLELPDHVKALDVKGIA